MLERHAALEAELGEKVWLAGFWSDGNDLEWLEWLAGTKSPPLLLRRLAALDRRCAVVANVMRLRAEGKVKTYTLDEFFKKLDEEEKDNP